MTAKAIETANLHKAYGNDREQVKNDREQATAVHGICLTVPQRRPSGLHSAAGSGASGRPAR